MRWCPWGLMATALVSSGARAQIIRGAVRADSTLAPIGGAEIWLEPSGSRVRADRFGNYRFDPVLLGPQRLSARAVGFRPLTVDAVVAAADTIDIDLVLIPIAVQLAPLEVMAALPGALSARMREFEERRQAGFGRFLTRAELERYDHGPVTSALRMIAGLRLLPLPCNGGYAVATAHGGSEISGKPLSCSGVSGRNLPVPQGCYLSIYLDGVLIWSWGNTLRGGGGDLDKEPPNIDAIKALDLQAVEVYRGPAELPIRYQGTNSACGAVLFWTREQ